MEKVEKVTVGSGMTAVLYTDLLPYVVVRVSESGKTAWVQPLLEAEQIPGAGPRYYKGPWPVWEYAYSPEEIAKYQVLDPHNPEPRRVFLGKDGWKSGSTRFLPNRAIYRRDYSF